MTQITVCGNLSRNVFDTSNTRIRLTAGEEDSRFYLCQQVYDRTSGCTIPSTVKAIFFCQTCQQFFYLTDGGMFREYCLSENFVFADTEF